MFDRQSLYITAIGQLGTGGGAGEESFSFGVRFTGLSPFDATAALAALDEEAIAVLYGEYFVDTDIGMVDSAHLLSIKVAAIGTDGTYVVEPKEAEPEPGGVSGTFEATRYPNQVALGVSFQTATTIGHATRGRFYLPIPAFTVDEVGLIPALAATNVATRTAQLLSDLNDELAGTAGPDAAASIMSFAGSGTTRGITTVRCGRVLDTIRSRRSSLAESYSAEVALT